MSSHNPATKVVTRTTCSICKAAHEREGVAGFCPPVGWTEVTDTTRKEGAGWTNSHMNARILCPACWDGVLGYMESKRREREAADGE